MRIARLGAVTERKTAERENAGTVIHKKSRREGLMPSTTGFEQYAAARAASVRNKITIGPTQPMPAVPRFCTRNTAQESRWDRTTKGSNTCGDSDLRRHSAPDCGVSMPSPYSRAGEEAHPIRAASVRALFEGPRDEPRIPLALVVGAQHEQQASRNEEITTT